MTMREAFPEWKARVFEEHPDAEIDVKYHAGGCIGAHAYEQAYVEAERKYLESWPHYLMPGYHMLAPEGVEAKA